MAFNVPYGSLIDRNINHLYTTREKTVHRHVPRQKLYRSELLDLEIQASERAERRNPRRRKPILEFVPEFDIEVPRAPAFRKASKATIDEIVERLTQRSNTRVVTNNSRNKYQRGSDTNGVEEGMPSPRDSMTSERMNSIVNRLIKPVGCRRRHPSPNLREEDYLPNFVI